jgi:cytochrome P450
VFAPLIGNGIFTQEGSAWKHSRELLRKQFARTRYQDLERFKEHVDNLIASIPRSGVLDLQPLFFSLTLDTTTALLFGESVYSLRASIDQDAEHRLFAESFNIAQEGLAKRFRIVPWHFLYSPPVFKRACRRVHRYVERYIESKDLRGDNIAPQEKSSSFVDQVAAESENIAELRDQLLNVLLAGRDTAACCLSWTLYVYSNPPPFVTKICFHPIADFSCVTL